VGPSPLRLPDPRVRWVAVHPGKQQAPREVRRDVEEVDPMALEAPGC